MRHWIIIVVLSPGLFGACLPESTEDEGVVPDAARWALDAATQDGGRAEAGLDAADPDAASLSPGQVLPDAVDLIAAHQCRWLRLLDDEVHSARSSDPAVVSAAVADGRARVCAQAEGAVDVELWGAATFASAAVSVRLDDSPFAVEVVDVDYGSGAGFGQGDFPDVVLGPPEGGGAGAGSLDVLSLGAQGHITLRLGLDVVDGPGPDLIVFENPFSGWWEPGQVALSADGVDFVSFACDPSEPYTGCAGTHVVTSSTQNDVDPTDPDVAGGDAYDLAELGLPRARYVRITDIAGTDTGGGAAGFDLDAVAAVFALPDSATLTHVDPRLDLAVGQRVALRVDARLGTRIWRGLRVQCRSQDPGVARLDPDCLTLRALAAGQTELRFWLGEHELLSEVSVQ